MYRVDLSARQVQWPRPESVRLKLEPELEPGAQPQCSRLLSSFFSFYRAGGRGGIVSNGLQAALRPGGILSQTAGTDCDGYPSALRLTLAALLLTSAAAPQRVAGASAAAAAEERSVFVSASANPFWASLGHGHGESNDVRRDG